MGFLQFFKDDDDDDDEHSLESLLFVVFATKRLLVGSRSTGRTAVCL
jgi:hypothetical protein